MSGLLHRLAARAAGTARLVRSDARLPYGAEALLWASAPGNPVETDIGALPEGAGGILPIEDAAPSGSDSLAPESAGPRQGPDDVARQGTGVRGDTGPTRELHGARRATSSDAAPESGQRQSMKAPAPARPDPEPPILAAAGPRGPNAAAPLLSQVDAAGTETPPLRQTTPAASALLPLPALDAMLPGTHDYAPLLPPLPQSTQRDRSAPTSEPAEVHIHIGRIEVMALTDPPPRRPKPEAKAPSQSLDAYLAARSGR